MGTTIRDQIIEQVDRLNEPQQRQLLDLARRLAAPDGTPGGKLLRLAGRIAPADLEAMSQAIEEGCEQVDPNAW
jgi:hypothetical protein